MKPLLIFFVLLFLGAMFLIGEHPEYNPLASEKQDTNLSSSQVLDKHIKDSDKHMGEQ